MGTYCFDISADLYSDENSKGLQLPKILYKIVKLKFRDYSLAKKIRIGDYL